jgi:hypothetical protein
MKKGKKWFKLLSDVEQEQFKVNCGEEFDEIMEDRYTNFRNFLGGCFTWVDSLEGYDYWQEIYYRNEN